MLRRYHSNRDTHRGLLRPPVSRPPIARAPMHPMRPAYRRPNPGTLSDFAEAFGNRIGNLRESGDWFVWDVLRDARGVKSIVAEQKALGYGSAWCKHGQMGVLQLQVD